MEDLLDMFGQLYHEEQLERKIEEVEKKNQTLTDENRELREKLAALKAERK